jgi:DNA-binding CsgD family transcriptional regulator
MIFFFMNGERSSPDVALIFYRPGKGKRKQKVFYNEEAWNILSRPSLPREKKETTSFPDLDSYCSKWRVLLDEKKAGSDGHYRSASAASIIDFFISGRRQYAVKGSVVSSYQGNEKQYIFMLERFSPDKLNLSMVLRQWDLSQREKDLAVLLLKGKSNKEIAYILDLSLHTVKSYMKLLSRKLEVSGRTQIVSRLVSGNK